MSGTVPGMESCDLTTIDALARRVQAGDEEAFVDLVERCHRPLRLAVAALGLGAARIDELAQAAWTEAYEHLASWRGEGPFLAWLIGIARNLVRADLARARRRRDVPLAELGEAVGTSAGTLSEEPTDERFERWLAHLPTCLERLAPRARRLIEARYRQGESLARLAVRFHQRSDRLATTLWRARAALRRCLEGEAS